MANIKSSKKRARQSELRREHNASKRSRMRTAIKRVRRAIEAGDKTLAASALRTAYSVLDSTVGKGVVHKNMTLERQAEQVRIVKKYEAGVIKDPITVTPDTTIREVQELRQRHNISGVPVVDQEGFCVGIISQADLALEDGASSDAEVGRVVEQISQPTARLLS